MHSRIAFLAVALVLGPASPTLATEGDFEFWPGASYDPSVPTMKEVLGYQPGERIASHAEIMTYLDALAAALPNRIKVVEYARSWEGRKLVNAFIGSDKNIARLDTISDGMKRLADPRRTPESEAQQLIESLPAITWLAYGIHGNEISSPEASLVMAYHLLAAQNDEVVDAILADSIVVLDPTQNPDGRDRFVHNFRIAEGLEPAAHPLAAEHNEPWPGGRTNHYYFDLNRDWLALTQPETRGRVRVLQEWFPAVFVDLHEMGSNSTYYFSPEAIPYNPHITAEQRASLALYGRNNGKWFDRFGFDYFTREVFDAFYPGYGASWPLYHGSIASTYEQASARGLVYRRSDGVDLLFRETVRHHFVASVSTAETTARNRSKLLSNFYRYRQSAIEEGRTGRIREYILPSVPHRGDRSTVAKLVGLLVEQGVEVRRATSSLEACGKEYPEGSYAISLAQPTKRLIRTLLDTNVPMEEDFVREQERRRGKRMTDQIYDVTGWSLPIMFNVECVPCGEEAQGRFEMAEPVRIPPGKLEGGKATVAYLAPWGTAASGRLLAAALREGLRVFSTDKAFTQSGVRYPSGTLIFKVSQNPPGMHETLERLAESTGVEIQATDSGWVEEGVNFGSRNVLHVRPPRIALAWDSPTRAYSAGATRFVLERQFGYPVTPIRSRQLVGADLSPFDVLILPEGTYSSTFKPATAELLKNWVRAGGTLIGIGNALNYLTEPKVDLLEVEREYRAAEEVAKDRQQTEEESKARSEGKLLANEKDYLEAIQPAQEEPDDVQGVLVKAELDPDDWMTAGLDGTVNALVNGRIIYSPITLDKGVNAATFLGPDELLASGYLWEESRKQLAYKPFIMVQKHGRGVVVGFTADPNYRAYLDGLNVLFLNAVFRGPARARPAVAP